MTTTAAVVTKLSHDCSCMVLLMWSWHILIKQFKYREPLTFDTILYSFKYYHQNNFSAACILYLFLPFQKVIIKVWYLHIKGICSLNNESWNNYTFPNAIEKYIGVISWLLHHRFGKIEILTRKVKWCGFYYSFH